ncbi:MAG: glycoside hydrolase family 2 TIM barrel-domain containing protein [Planctomycetota bacterium]
MTIVGCVLTGVLGSAICGGIPAYAGSDASRAAGGPAAIANDTLRVTPPVSAVADLPEFHVSLNGAWGFMKDVPPDFDPADPGFFDWAEVTLPGHFALQGHGRMHKEFGVPVAYYKTVGVPDDWDGRRVVMRFDSIEGLTRIYVNGEFLLERDTHYLPVELDITDAVTPGEDVEIVMTIAASSITQWWRPEKGSFRRDAWLMALPEVNLSSLNVTTDFDEAYEDAVMRVEYEVANQSGAPAEAATLALTLTGPAGEAVDLGEHATYTLPVLPSGQARRSVLEVPIKAPAHWNTDTPNLYTLSVTLGSAAGEVAAQRRFGFRELEVDGPRLLLNGSVVKLRGVNFHQTWPGTDYFTPVEKLRKDMELFKAANLNYLRIWPAPDEAVMAAADEMGLLMQVEVPISMFIYRGNEANNYGNDPTYEPILHEWAEVMVEHYGSHPSAIIWSLGNECWYHDFFRTTAGVFNKLDPSRPIIFSGDKASGVGVEGVDINDDHYPRDGRLDFSVPGSVRDAAREDAKLSWFYPTDRPIMFSEWLHLPLGNIAEQRQDPALWDYFGLYAKAHADFTYHYEHVLGGALFTGTPVTAIHERVIIGLYDTERRINDAWWHVFKSMSPIQMELDKAGLPVNPGISPARFTVTNRSLFSDLSAYTFAYRQGPNHGNLTIKGAPGETAILEVPFEGERDTPLDIEVFGPGDRLVNRFHFVATNGGVQNSAALAPVNDGEQALTLKSDSDTIRVSGDGFAWEVDRTTGKFSHVELHGEALPVTGPGLFLSNSAHWIINSQGGFGPAGQQQLRSWEASDVKAKKRGKAVVVEVAGSYEAADAKLRYVFDQGGGLTVRYHLDWTGSTLVDVLAAGVTLGLPRSFDTLSWQRDAIWTAYPENHIGRPMGTAPALGDPKWDDARASHREGDKKPWPWSQDISEYGHGTTNDFRSTKSHARQVTLANADGRGLAVLGKGDVHVRVGASEDQFTIHANPFWNGGTELHLVKSIRTDVMQVNAGSSIKGTVAFRLVPGEGHTTLTEASAAPPDNIQYPAQGTTP